jgi:hypothetical protein
MKSLSFAAALSLSLSSLPAHAVDFHYWDYDGGLSQNAAARKSYQVAIDYWSSVLKDDVTVNLLITGERFYNDHEVTAAVTQVDQSTYALTEWVYQALAADSTSALDAQAVAKLSPLTPSEVYPDYNGVTVLANDFNDAGGYADETIRVDADGSANNVLTLVNRATAKAMNLESASGQIVDETRVDVVIYYSLDKAFDYDPTDGIDEGAYDFTGLAIRDIGIALGLDSYNSAYDYNTGPTTTADNSVETAFTAKTIDLFRYSEAGTLDWSTSETDKYFSIDGGETALFGNASYRKGENNGDKALATFWKDDANGEALGIMDADPGTGNVMAVSALDLAAVDVIGWDLSFDVSANSGYRLTTAQIYAAMTAVPEPATWLQMLLGFGLVGGATRRRLANGAIKQGIAV